MKPKYWHATIVVLSLLAASTQPALGTKYIPTDTSIGTWDPYSRIYTLNTDLNEMIEIVEDNLTLDGDGYTVTGSGGWQTIGVSLIGRTGVTIKNLNVQRFTYGIYLYNSDSIILTGNTAASNSGLGIYLLGSSENTLRGNSAGDNAGGILVSGSSKNTLMKNTANSNRGSPAGYGICLYDSSQNTLTENTASWNRVRGIYVRYSSDNNLRGNTADWNDQCGIYLYENSSDNILTGNTCSNNVRGISFSDYSSNNTLTGNTVSNNSFVGIHLGRYTDNNILSGNTANSNDGYGIFVERSSRNTLTDNTANANRLPGIGLSYSHYNTLTGNTTSNNSSGIELDDSSSINTLTGNTASTNDRYGICLQGCGGNNTLTDNTANANNLTGISLLNSGGSTLRGNTMTDNHYNFGAGGGSVSDHNIDTSNIVDGKPIYYVTGVSDAVYGGSTDVGVFYAVNCERITIKDLALTNNLHGVFLWNTHNSTIENISASNNGSGIFVERSSGNTLTNNTVNLNDYRGIQFHRSDNNILSDNSVALNGYGIYLSYSIHSQIYNNNFIDNETQVYVHGGGYNVFNLLPPVGGNYWSDYTGEDTNGDGIGETPYTFTGGVDNFAWVVLDGWLFLTPEQGIKLLMAGVVAMNLPKGFVGKLNDAIKVLTDAHPNNDRAACNKLNDFIDQVNGKADKISDAGGDPYALIDAAEAIIAMLEAG